MKSWNQMRRGGYTLIGVMLAAGLLAACSKGGGDDVAPPAPAAAQGVTVSGNASAPNGSLARTYPSQGFLKWFASLFVGESYAQAGGPAPLQNRRVVVFQANDNGTVVKPSLTNNPDGIIAEGQTDVQGNYGMVLPVGLKPASNLFVQVSDDAVGSAPRSVGSANVLNAQAVREIVPLPNIQIVVVDLSPAAELAAREIIARTAPAGGATLLGNFTPQEVSAFVGLLQSASAQVTGTTVQNTIDNILAQSQTLITDTLNLIEPPGQVVQPGGTYSVARYFSEYDSTGRLRRYLHTGDAVLDPATGTFRFQFTEAGGQVQEACSTSCSRTFAAGEFNRSDVITGSYLFQTANNTVSFTPGSSFTPFTLASGESLIAHASPDTDRSLVVLPFRGQFGILGFGLAVKKGSGLTSNDIAGTFHFIQFGALLSQSSIFPTGPWTGPLSGAIGSGTVSFAPPNIITANGNASIMGQEVTCTLTQTGCTLAASLTSLIELISVNGSYTMAPDGTFTISQPQPPPNPAETFSGTLAANKHIALIPLPDIEGGSITIATRQAPNLAVSGTYNVVMYRDFLDTSARIRTMHYEATAVFTGGNVTFTGPDGTVQERTESCPSAASCSFSFGVPGTPGINVNNGTYTVNPTTAAVTINIPGFGNFTGSALQDGSFIVVSHTFDNQNNNSGRAIALLVKQ
jgi:hypothetical protein